MLHCHSQAGVMAKILSKENLSPKAMKDRLREMWITVSLFHIYLFKMPCLPTVPAKIRSKVSSTVISWTTSFFTKAVKWLKRSIYRVIIDLWLNQPDVCVNIKQSCTSALTKHSCSIQLFLFNIWYLVNYVSNIYALGRVISGNIKLCV